MKKVAIIQSNYIPWKGYFDIIASVDHFVFLEDVQYTRRDWRNRNKIMTAQGPSWLSIPVDVAGKFEQTVREVEVADKSWADKHFKSLVHAYSRAPHFSKFKEQVQELYQKASKSDRLSPINQMLVGEICKMLKIETKLHDSSQFQMEAGKSARLMSICRALGADVYVSGPAAKCYMDESVFKENGMSVEWYQYGTYKNYHQLHSPKDITEHAVSVLDLIFNAGDEARNYMREAQNYMCDAQ